LELMHWFVIGSELFSQDKFHGNVKWGPEQLAAQAIIWSLQETRNVTDAFDQTMEICEDLGLDKTAKSYTSFMNALDAYSNLFIIRMRNRFQFLAKEIGGRYFEADGWVPIGFDGSRATAPRSVANEKSFCAPNNGKGKGKGKRSKRDKKKRKTQPQEPQAWITMMWHMQLRVPWTWRLGPSNSSERHHVKEMIDQEVFPENTLFCGDAGFVGYPLWKSIINSRKNFVVRVGANVRLLSETADVKRLGGGVVLCWPKGKMQSGDPPLRLRLVKVKIGKTKMWLLTSVVEEKRLNKNAITRLYKNRWGIEVEFRGLKQTIDKSKLRCRNSDRLLVELDWSLRAMAVAELLALREQIPAHDEQNSKNAKASERRSDYTPKDRSLANTMRALRKCMRNLNKFSDEKSGILFQLSQALVQRYKNNTNKQARYRPKNPDKKPLGDPEVRKINASEVQNMKNTGQIAA